MFSALAVADIVGLAVLRLGACLDLTDFWAASATTLTSSSRVSGFLVSIPDILLLPLSSQYIILYIKVSEHFHLFRKELYVFATFG